MEASLRIGKSKSWVDKMMDKYDGSLHYKDKQMADMDARAACQSGPLGSAPARHLRLLRARLVAPCSSSLPG